VNRRLAIAAYATAATLGAVLVGSGAVWLVLRFVHLGTVASAWALSAVYVVVIAWAVTFVWLYWRRLDEAAKEAQKFAWFYGAVAAMFVTAPMILFVRLDGGAFLAVLAPSHPTPGAYFALGWISLALAQAIGFLVVWAGWWRAKR
jgi:hypothetical protein